MQPTSHTDKHCWNPTIIGLHDIRVVALEPENPALGFVPVLPFGLDGNHEAQAIEASMKSLVKKEQPLADCLRQLRNALIGLHRCSKLRHASLRETMDKRIATYRFIHECCLETIGCYGLAGLPAEVQHRLWLLSVNGGFYVCIPGEGAPKQSITWAISWQTELPIHFGYTGTKALLPAWSAGLWARAASMCDRLIVV